MSADYRVRLNLFAGPRFGTSYEWIINRGDAPSLPEVLDGLTIGWQFPEGNLWPVQPEPVTMSFSLIAESAADLAGIDRGISVYADIWAGVNVAGVDRSSVTFVGQITDAVGYPVKFGHPVTGDEVDGWRIDLIAVDTTAALGEYVVAGVQPDSLSVRETLIALWHLAGTPHTSHADPGADSPFMWVDGGEGSPLLVTDEGVIEPADVLTVTERILAGYADGGFIAGDPSVPTNHARYAAEGWRRGIVRPGGDPQFPWEIRFVSRRYGKQVPYIGTNTVLPAAFVDLGGGVYGVRIEPPASGIDASIVVDAAYLDYGAAWTRTKLDEPNVVDVANSVLPADQGPNPWSRVTAVNLLEDESPVLATIPDSVLAEPWDAAAVAEMYLDDSANGTVVWSASGFRWYASQDPSWPIVRSLFPETLLFGEYGAPVVITGIPAHQRPDGRPWYVGVPRAVQWTFDRGEFEIAFDLYPRTPKAITAANVGLTWAELAAEFPAVDWTDLHPEHTWLDYRLVRSTTYA